MLPRFKTSSPNWPRRMGGYSLIVMIAIVAIIAIVTLPLLRALLREVDHEVARKESATLKAQKQALERSIVRNLQIPGPDEWASAVANELGANVGTIETNPRRQARLLVVDTSGVFSTLALPYTQGTANPPKPTNARMMIVSSLGVPLPNLGNTPTPDKFAALWNCAEGQVPTSAPWDTWDGRADDVKVERLALDSLFVELRLVTGAQSGASGLFSIGAPSTTPATAPVQQQVNPPWYVLRGTKVWLYDHYKNLDSRQIVNKNCFYRYEDDIWKSNAAGADLPGGLDLAAVVKGFLNATPNTNALYGAAQQSLVASSMMDFMRGYIAWGEKNFNDATLKANLEIMQDNMMLRCQELFINGGAKNNFYPINQGNCP